MALEIRHPQPILVPRHLARVDLHARIGGPEMTCQFCGHAVHDGVCMAVEQLLEICHCGSAQPTNPRMVQIEGGGVYLDQSDGTVATPPGAVGHNRYFDTEAYFQQEYPNESEDPPYGYEPLDPSSMPLLKAIEDADDRDDSDNGNSKCSDCGDQERLIAKHEDSGEWLCGPCYVERNTEEARNV